MGHTRFLPLVRCCLALCLGVLSAWTGLLAQGTAFIYQGQLTDGPSAANGTYDLRFTLWDAATAGDQQGATVTQTAVGVTNGLFTATLDFGAQFTGAGRWLEIAVRTNGAADFTTLAERQPVLPTPYAMHATTATTATTVTGSVPVTQLTGTLSAAQIPNLDAGKIASGVLSPDRIPTLDASRISGGTFTGNGAGLNGIPLSALVQSDYSVAAWGGNDNGQTDIPDGLGGVVGIAASGNHSLALKADGTVVAWGDNFYGQTNVPAGLSGVVAVAAGATHNLALKADGAVVAWGYNGLRQTDVPAGLSGVVAIAGGGFHSLALKADGTVVAWGDNFHGQTNVPAGLSGVVAIAGGGYHCLALKADGTVVAWGRSNENQSPASVGLSGVKAISAGQFHSLALKAGIASQATLARLDRGNVFRGSVSALGFSGNGSGLTSLNASALSSGTLGDARLSGNVALLNGSPAFAPAAGTRAAGFTGSRTGDHDDAVVHAENTSTSGSASPALRVLGRGTAADGALSVSADAGPIARFGNATTWVAQIDNAGGFSAASFSGNGSALTSLNASALSSGTVPVARIPSLDAGKVTTGTFATAQIPNLDADKITAGTLHPSRIPGLSTSWINSGIFSDDRLSANVALQNGSPSFAPAAGTRAAGFTGSRTGDFNAAVAHVENTHTTPAAAPALRVLSRGGDSEGALSVSADAGVIARFGNLTTWVAKLDNGGNFSATSFIILSDRNKKAGFAPVDVETVLAKVAALPLTTWHYTNDPAATPHLGPMAQDFRAAFGLGGEDTSIASVDADGVALAAIQGLHRKTEVLAAENAELKVRLERLEALLLNPEASRP